MGSLYEKDDRATQITLGAVAPALLAVHTVYCYATGYVFCFRGGRVGRFTLEWADDQARFTFWISFQIAAIIAMVSWFWIANEKAWERWAEAGVLLAGAVLAVGTALSLYDALW